MPDLSNTIKFSKTTKDAKGYLLKMGNEMITRFGKKKAWKKEKNFLI